MSYKPSVLFTMIIVVSSVLVSVTFYLNKNKIEHNQEVSLLGSIYQVIPKLSFSPEIQSTKKTFISSHYFMTDKPQYIYFAKINNKTKYLLFDVTTPFGYSGDIRLLIAINNKQKVVAARVIAHQETPGLGDKFTVDKSDWIRDFNGKSLNMPSIEKWTIKKEGGYFDSWTGASITPRAVTIAIKQTLLYTQDHYAELFT